MTFVAGTVLTAAALNTALAAKTDTAMVQNAQTGTSYSYALADASKLLSMSNAASNTVLVTKQATVTWITGTQLRVINLGAGVTTLVADTGVTINGNVALGQYQGGTLVRTATDVWVFQPNAQKVLQIVRATDVTARSTTSTSFADASISVTITPRQITSNVILMWTFNATGSTSRTVSFQLTNSANVAISGAEAQDHTFAANCQAPFNLMAYIAPGTISPVTYKGRFKAGATNTLTLNNALSTGQLYAIEVSA